MIYKSKTVATICVLGCFVLGFSFQIVRAEKTSTNGSIIIGTCTGVVSASMYIVGRSERALISETLTDANLSECCTESSNGRFFFVMDRSSNRVFSIPLLGRNRSLGIKITKLPVESVEAFGHPCYMLVDPSDKFLYILNLPDLGLSSFSMRANGSLKYVNSISIGSWSHPPCSIALNPNRRALYVGYDGGNIVIVTIRPNGSLRNIKILQGKYNASQLYTDPLEHSLIGIGTGLSIYRFNKDYTLRELSKPTALKHIGIPVVSLAPNGKFVFITYSGSNSTVDNGSGCPIDVYQIHQHRRLSYIGSGPDNLNLPLLATDHNSTHLYALSDDEGTECLHAYLVSKKGTIKMLAPSIGMKADAPLWMISP
jgi:6-phosphogluconolactonase (cycloisomerase 2 family)